MENKFKPVGRVKKIKGSILLPENSGLCLILNVADLSGKPNSPLYALFDRKWRKVKEDVKGWKASQPGFYKLGAIRDIAVQSDVWVVHMLCQSEDLKVNKKDLSDCLKKVRDMAKYEKATIHVSNLLLDIIPEFEVALEENLLKEGINVTFYEEK